MSQIRKLKRKNVKNQELRVKLLKKIFAKKYREYRAQLRLKQKKLVEDLKIQNLQISEKQNRDLGQPGHKESFMQQIKIVFSSKSGLKSR